ncbi:MAG: hypothetical protein RLZZ501_1567 [Pseudomonadota bacterium]|jgi:hypothetical protein
MPLSRYAAEAQGLTEELRLSLSQEDIEYLRRHLASIGADGWLSWKEKNANHIYRYASSSPSERKRRKEWSDPAIKTVLVFAAMQHLQMGTALLSEMVASRLEPGIGYRDMAAAAGDAYRRLLRRLPSDWPFEGESPFQKS